MDESSKAYFIKVFGTGLLMGAADLVPGISGGTIALLAGIYERLLLVLGKLDITSLKLLINGRLAQLWLRIDGNFLLALMAGIGCSLLTLAHVLLNLLKLYPLPLWSMFLGMILAASYRLLSQLQLHNVVILAGLLAGIGLSLFINSLQIQGDMSANLGLWEYLSLFGAGAIAVSAMILPGISGSFLLLLMGIYPFMLSSLVQLEISVLACFAVGGAFGLLTFGRFLAWLLQCYRIPMLALLSGLMLGATINLWPWRQVLSYRLNHAGEIVPLRYKNLWPWEFSQVSGLPNQWLICIIAFTIGLLLVLLFSRRTAPDAQVV